jgi:hypothetical protein
LRDILAEKNSIGDLWTIDYIISLGYYSREPRPRTFEKGTFVFFFLDSIYNLAVQGNSDAIDKFLGIKLFAEGWYAEYMDEKILGVFENYPETVIKNWSIVKKYISGFRYSEYQFKADSMIKKYKKLCERADINSMVCREIIEFLEQKEKGQ